MHLYCENKSFLALNLKKIKYYLLVVYDIKGTTIKLIYFDFSELDITYIWVTLGG